MNKGSNKDMMSFDEALSALLDGAVAVGEIESVPTQAATGRVLAEDLVSAIAVPPLDNSAMDGYAVRCADLSESGATLRIAQRIPAGSVGHALAVGTAARIFTGAPIPQGADAVVMQELCTVSGDTVSIARRPRLGESIRRKGEDIAEGQIVLSAGSLLGPAELGVAASVGAANVAVFRRYRVALFSTGNELAMPGEALKPGGIYNSNRYTLTSLLERLGCTVSDMGIVPDDLEATRAMLREAAAAHDLILTSGGVSVGEEDYVKSAVEAEGHLGLWKVALKPGKPLAFGSVNRVAAGHDLASDQTAAAFIGLPGNPVSSFVTFVMLVRPFILKAQGRSLAQCLSRAIHLRADFDWKGDPRREFLRARINAHGGLDLFANQGSGVLTSCAWADGLIDNPPGQAIASGDSVNFLPFSALL